MHILAANLAERGGDVIRADLARRRLEAHLHDGAAGEVDTQVQAPEDQREQPWQNDGQRDAEEPPLIPCEVKHALFLRLASRGHGARIYRICRLSARAVIWSR